MTEDYSDKNITCGSDGVTIRWYYFPMGTKTIPYSSIKGLQRVDMGLATGRARIWGTANPGLWASLDAKRTSKRVALILDLGKTVKPFITPDDPDAAEKVIRERSGLGPSSPTTNSPFL